MDYYITVRKLFKIAGASGEPEGGCSEQHGVRGECSTEGPGVRVRRGHLPAPEASERAPGRAGPGAGRARHHADPVRKSGRNHLHGDGPVSADRLAIS